MISVNRMEVRTEAFHNPLMVSYQGHCKVNKVATLHDCYKQICSVDLMAVFLLKSCNFFSQHNVQHFDKQMLIVNLHSLDLLFKSCGFKAWPQVIPCFTFNNHWKNLQKMNNHMALHRLNLVEAAEEPVTMFQTDSRKLTI